MSKFFPRVEHKESQFYHLVISQNLFCVISDFDFFYFKFHSKLLAFKRAKFSILEFQAFNLLNTPIGKLRHSECDSQNKTQELHSPSMPCCVALQFHVGKAPHARRGSFEGRFGGRDVGRLQVVSWRKARGPGQ